METDGADDPAPRRRGSLAIALLPFLAGLPFLFARYPQLTDYPSHLARYRVMLDQGHDAWLARYYAFDWIVAGNLGADLLMWPLGRLFGVETAGWLIGLAIPVLTGLGVLAVMRALHRPAAAGALLAFATIWSPAMSMGFYNFCLSLALALFAFAAWIRLDGRPWRSVVFVPTGIAVWLCHASGWGVLGILVFGYEWSRRKDWRAFLAPWPLLPPVALQLMAGGAKGSLDFGNHVVHYKLAIWLQAFRDRSEALDIATLAILLLVTLVALFRRQIDGRLGWAALLCGILSFAVPRHLGGGDYADYRLIPVSLMLAMMAVTWRGRGPVLLLAGSLFLVRLGVTATAWHDESQATGRMLSVLDHLPQGARVAGAVLIERRRWGLDPFEHLTSYATVYKSALVNSHFAIPGVHMLRLREGGPGFADPSHRVFHTRGEPVDLSHFAPAAQADWLWYVGPVEPAVLPAGAVIVARAPGSLLVRLAKAAPAR